MNASRAFGAGVLGGLVMTIVAGLGRWVGLPINIEATLGSMFGLDPMSGSTWLLGLVIHLMLSGLIGLLYGLGFERVTHRASTSVGVAFSVIHLIIGGLVIAMLPAIHPMIPEMMAAPGAFMANLGVVAVIAFIVVHLLYGAVVGAMYAGEVTTPERSPLPA